jgi:hypothetical protein
MNFIFLFKCFNFSPFFSFSYILSSYTSYSSFILSSLFIFLCFSFLIALVPIFCLLILSEIIYTRIVKLLVYFLPSFSLAHLYPQLYPL